MGNGNHQGKPITDYFAKLSIIYTLFGISRDYDKTDLLESLIPNWNKESASEQNKIKGFISKGYRQGFYSKEDSAEKVSSAIANHFYKSEVSEDVYLFAFTRYNKEIFFDLLQTDFQEKLILKRKSLFKDVYAKNLGRSFKDLAVDQINQLETLLSPLNNNSHPIVCLDSTYFMKVDSLYRFPSINKVVRDYFEAEQDEIIIEHSLIYSTPNSAYLWDEFQKHYSYQIQNFCLTSLRNLMLDNCWSENVMQNEKYSSFIVLTGGGSFVKDSEILNQLVYQRNEKQNHKVEYRLIDTSTEMLHASQIEFMKWLENLEVRDKQRISFSTERGDVTKLAQFFAPSKNKASHVFFLIGSTLSNLDQDDFIESISSIASTDDYLVIGQAFISSSQYENFENNIELWTKYYSEVYVDKQTERIFKSIINEVSNSIVEYLENPNRAIANVSIPSVQEILKTIEIQVKSYSDNLNKIEVNLLVDFLGHKINLLKSSRIESDSFIKMMKKYGWEIQIDIKTIGIKNDQKLAIEPNGDQVSNEIFDTFEYVVFKKLK